jgi:hypothetical protein
VFFIVMYVLFLLYARSHLITAVALYGFWRLLATANGLSQKVQHCGQRAVGPWAIYMKPEDYVPCARLDAEKAFPDWHEQNAVFRQWTNTWTCAFPMSRRRALA